MKDVSRRSFVTGAAAGVAALGFLGGSEPAANAQLVWKASQWKIADFRSLVVHPAQIKQVYDIVQIRGGLFLNNVKNSLNGLQFGFAVPHDQMKIVAALHGPANMLNFDDYVWKKYGIGEWLNVTDPATGKPAERNIFYPEAAALKTAAAANNPDNENSIDQAKSIQALQSRGVQFLCCHTAAEEQARVLIRRNKLTAAPEEVVKDMLAHTLPGVLVVAAMVAAIALLQAEGHYTYITI